ncbi:class I SAM-dependent methyltransferase [candidate division KSB1 bacterium]|nr:class I SAM-dependent methyltransferase [candidate division KSB1 bacterium]
MTQPTFRSILTSTHVCPWWIGYTFDNPLRRIFQNPRQILAPYVKHSATVVDIGCGMGYYSIAMAKLVGKEGKVLSVDIQPQMLAILSRRARKNGVAERIETFQDMDIFAERPQSVDFCLTFWMLHEVPDKKAFLAKIFNVLKPDGKYLLVEPKIHTTVQQFGAQRQLCTEAGLNPIDSPKIGLSRTALFIKAIPNDR